MRLFLILLIVILAGAGYIFLQETQQQTASVNQPDVVQDELSRMAAERHIETLTATTEDAIGIGQANHFVSKDQLLKIPAARATTAAGTETADNSNATTFAVKLESFGEKPQPDQVISADTLPEADQIRLKELLNNPDADSETLFYIHGVTNSDQQGLWGIIQNGLIHTFAKGIKLETSLVSTDIPRSADERLANSNSSFLGAILDKKVKDTYVYNYEKGILGQNPDLINPGQELIIVTFTRAELVDIYNHFAQQQ